MGRRRIDHQLPRIELQIPVFKRFAMEQVHATQQSLEALFHLGTDESRAQVVPRIALDRLRDDPTNTKRGWSFLKDRRDVETLPPSETWLLRRMIGTDWLRDRFCTLDSGRNIVWDLKEGFILLNFSGPCCVFPFRSSASYEPSSLQTHASKYLLYFFRRNNLIGSPSAPHPGRPYRTSVFEVSMPFLYQGLQEHAPRALL